MYKSVIKNLIGSICSPHLRSVSVNLETMVWEMEHFPWGTVNDLAKVSPYMLQRVEVGLRLLVETYPVLGLDIPLSPSEYEGYFRQICLALPELDKRVIPSISVRHPESLC